MKKEDEIAATNKLLRLIRGEKDLSDKPTGRGFLEAGEEKADAPADPAEGGEIYPFGSQPNKSDLPPESSSDLDFSAEVERKEYPSDEPKAFDSASTQGASPGSRSEEQGGREGHFSSQRFLSAATLDGEEIYRRQGEIKGNIKSTLGIDIGSRYIKYVQIQRRMNKYYLISWGIIKNANHKPSDWSSSIGTLRGLFSAAPLAHTRVISAVGGSSVIVRHIKFPPLSNKEIEESIRWEAKSYVPFPLRDVNIDYQILGRSAKNKQMDVLLVAVTKKLLQEHLDMLQSIQLKASVVDINSLALVNAFSANNPLKDERAVVLLDIGASTTILNIYKKDDLYLTRDIPIAGDAFTNAIQKEKQISFQEAESIKHDKNFDLNIIRPTLDNLTKEIRRSLIYYDNQTSRRGFSRLVLTGGSCRMAGLVSYFSEELGLAVEIANPFQAVQIDPRKFAQDELQFFSPQMALAFGLASRVN